MAIGTAAAIIGAAGIGAAASSSAANKAANTQAAAADRASALQNEQFNISRADQLAQLTQLRQDQAPWLGTGTNSVNLLALMLGLDETNAPEIDKAGIRARLYNRGTGITDEAALQAAVNSEAQRMEQDRRSAREATPEFGSLMRTFSMSDFQQDPGYQFRLAEGEKALQRSMAARGGMLSGAAAKALIKYNQDMASQEYGNAYQRYSNDNSTKFNRLASLAGVGQTSANLTGNAGMTTAANIGNAGISTANNIGQNIMGAGNARASGYVGTANAVTNGINQGMNFYQGNQLLSTLQNRAPSYGGYDGFVGNSYSNGFGDAFTNMSNPAYG